jgi:hypothetical protein
MMTARLELGRKVGPGPLSEQLRSEFTYSVISVAPSKGPPADKRSNERLRTRLRAGQLTDKRHGVIVDCLIQDRSHTGARLRLAQDRPLPKLFLLSDDVSQVQFWVQLAWQKGRDAGVKFVKV